MVKHKIINISKRPDLKYVAARWFSEKWDIPEEEYLASIDKCLSGNSAEPQWYIVMADDRIIGGCGVIDNDFHNRKDLSPNLCALYVEEDYRNSGIAGELLGFVCDDMRVRGMDTLYLITDHTSFYERYGWKFLCNVNCEGDIVSRMYVKRLI